MPVRPNLKSVDIPLMRRKEPFVDGYPMPFVTSMTDDLVQQQEAFEVYGYNQQIHYTFVDGANLRMDVINDQAMQALYDLSTGQIPYVTSTTRGYIAQGAVRCNVLNNTLNVDEDGYESVDFYPQWGRHRPRADRRPEGPRNRHAGRTLRIPEAHVVPRREEDRRHVRRGLPDCGHRIEPEAGHRPAHPLDRAHRLRGPRGRNDRRDPGASAVQLGDHVRPRR